MNEATLKRDFEAGLKPEPVIYLAVKARLIDAAAYQRITGNDYDTRAKPAQ